MLTVARDRGVYIRSAGDGNHNSIPEDLTNYKVARRGDLVINKMKAWQGSLGLAPVDGIVSPAYFVFDTAFEMPEFGQWLLRSRPYVAKFGAASDGIRVGQWDLDIGRMKNIDVALPTAEEQSAIVKYLTHATARIDHAIVTKRGLIRLLEEQCAGVAADVLARLDAPTVRLKFAMQSVTAGIWGDSPNESDEESRWCVRVADFDYDLSRVRAMPRTLRAVSNAEFEKRELRRGDLLLEGSGGGEKTPVGRVVLFDYDEPAVCSNFVQRLRTTSAAIPEYLAVVLKSFHECGKIWPLVKQTTGIQNLDLAAYLAIRIPLPTLSRQSAVLEEIRARSMPVRVLRDRAAAEVLLLREFRARLIADVVTGRADVRAIAAALPDVDPATAWDSARPSEASDDDLDEALADIDEEG